MKQTVMAFLLAANMMFAGLNISTGSYAIAGLNIAAALLCYLSLREDR